MFVMTLRTPALVLVKCKFISQKLSIEVVIVTHSGCTTTTAGHSSCTEDHCELPCDPAMKKANRMQATIYSGGMSS